MELADDDKILRLKMAKGIEALSVGRLTFPVKKAGQDGIFFLGTGGNPEAVINQKPATGGFVLSVDGTTIAVDPGPAAISQACRYALDLRELDGVYISHGHTDHYTGAPPVIEAMCLAMRARRGFLLAPQEVLAEKLISSYHQGQEEGIYRGGPEVIACRPFQPVTLGRVALMPVPAYHGGENYGFILKATDLTVGYTSDTNYVLSYRTYSGVRQVEPRGIFEDFLEVCNYRADLREVYREVDILIANVTSYNAWMHRHLTLLGLVHLLAQSKVKLCLLTHFNQACLYPEDITGRMASYLERSTGVPARPAKDGAFFGLPSAAKAQNG